MLPQLPISNYRSSARSAIVADRRRNDLVRQLDHYHIHYLIAYLAAVTGGLSQRGLTVHAVEFTSSTTPLSCSITFARPRPAVGYGAPGWVTDQADWDEQRGWCCQLHHVGEGQPMVRCYLGEPLVPAPEVVADFIAGLGCAQTLTTPGPAHQADGCGHTPQELADDLIRFTPSCTWIG